MSKFRITVTGDWVTEEDYDRGTEAIRGEIIDLLSSFPIEAEKVRLEDEYCIKANNKFSKATEIENQRLKSDNDYLVKEISKLARESIKREKALAKLEAEVMKRINEYDPDQMTLDECLYRQGD